jgi:hypothetical protein
MAGGSETPSRTPKSVAGGHPTRGGRLSMGSGRRALAVGLNRPGFIGDSFA